MSSPDAYLELDAVIRQLRSRGARARQRRRRQRLALTGAAVSLALASVAGVATLTGTDIAGAAVTRAHSLMDLMGQRSPGARTEAQLTKTVRHAVLAERSPEAPAMAPANFAEVLAPPPPAMLPVEIAPPAAELAMFAPPLPGAMFLSPPGAVGGSFPGGGSPGGPGGGGGPGGAGPGSPPDSPFVPPVPPAVPEPGTWMTMLAGFAMIGWSLRRRRPRFAVARPL